MPNRARITNRWFTSSSKSGANGSAAWCYPGGLRLDENSDFGIVAPDGLPRPAALQLQHYARALPAARVNPAPDSWITVDRDADARGFAGFCARWGADYARRRAEGKIPSVRSPATGLTTATMPLIAVGNVPAKGHNPLKYANAEIELLPTQNGALAYSVVNTGDVTWTQHGSGHVELLVFAGNRIIQRHVLPADVPRYGQIRLPVQKTSARNLTARLAIVSARAARNPTGVWPFGETFARNPPSPPGPLSHALRETRATDVAALAPGSGGSAARFAAGEGEKQRFLGENVFGTKERK